MLPASFALSLPLAAVLLLIAVPATITAWGGWQGTLRREGRLGVHSKAASSSDQAFGIANKVAAPIVGGAAAVALVAATLSVFLRLSTGPTLMIAAIGLVGGIVLLLAGGSLGERAARTVPIPARRPGTGKPGGASCDGCACGSGGCAGLTRSAPGAASEIA